VSSTINCTAAAIGGSEGSIAAALWTACQAGLTASTLELVMAWHWTGFSGWEPVSPADEYDPEEGVRRILDETAPGLCEVAEKLLGSVREHCVTQRAARSCLSGLGTLNFTG
jgi:hypothetical protein